MFCENCGNKMDVDSVFCEKCGARVDVSDNESKKTIQTTDEPKTTKTNNNKKLLYKHKFVDLWKNHSKTIIACGIVSILIITFVIIGSILSSPKRIAKNYFKAYMKNDFSKMYDLSDFDKDFFLTSKDNYIAVKQSNNKSSKKISSFTLKEQKLESSFSDSDDEFIDKYFNNFSDEYYKDKREEEKAIKELNSLSKTFIVTYYIKGDSEKHTYTLTLNKQDTNYMLFFKKYSVVNTDIINDFIISISKESKLSVDNQTIPEQYIDYDSESETSYDSYVIPYIFSGKHKIKITSDIYEDIEDEFNTNDSLNYSKNSNLKESIRQDLETKINDFSILLANTGFSNGNISTLNEKIPYSLESNEDLNKALNFIKQKSEWGDHDFNLSNVETTTKFIYDQIRVTSKCSYTAKSYYDDDIKGSFYFFYNLNYQNGIWQISELNYNNYNW